MATHATANGYAANDTRARDKYLEKLSGPLLDRIDIHIQVPAVSYQELTGRRAGTDSAAMRQRVLAARQIQRKRFGNDLNNARMDSRTLGAHAELSDECLRLMKQAMEELGLSARAYDKVRRVARTIADLESCDQISPVHLGEAIQYRLLDRRF